MSRKSPRPSGKAGRRPQTTAGSPGFTMNLASTREALLGETAYNDLLGATETGKRALHLRSEAEARYFDGDLEGAHALYLEAASLFQPTDTSPSAAECWTDLADSLTRTTQGNREENLHQARALMARTFDCADLSKAPLRRARNQDTLGRILMQLAEDAEPTEDFTKEAEEHFRKACAITEHVGPVGNIEGVQYQLNLARALSLRGRLDESETHYRRAVALATSLQRLPPSARLWEAYP